MIFFVRLVSSKVNMVKAIYTLSKYQMQVLPRGEFYISRGTLSATTSPGRKNIVRATPLVSCNKSEHAPLNLVNTFYRKCAKQQSVYLTRIAKASKPISDSMKRSKRIF